MSYSQVIIQVPVEKNLRDRALESAQELGFASLQDSIRNFLHQLAHKKIDLTWSTKTEPQLSMQAIKRYQKMISDLDSGKAKNSHFDNLDDALTHLDSL